jgi:hypothetical protein
MKTALKSCLFKTVTLRQPLKPLLTSLLVLPRLSATYFGRIPREEKFLRCEGFFLFGSGRAFSELNNGISCWAEELAAN